MTNSPFKNSLSKLDPYSDTDCDRWARDVFEVLVNPFKYEGKDERVVTDRQTLLSEEVLVAALAHFYLTHR